MKVSFKNENGLIRQVKVGFSWTALFFGPFPFLFRGMGGAFLIWAIAAICSLGLSGLILMFIINKNTAHHYLENGYKPNGEGWEYASAKWGVEPVKN